MQRDLLPANLRIPQAGVSYGELPEEPLHSFGLQLPVTVSVSVFRLRKSGCVRSYTWAIVSMIVLSKL